jgi:hypothetical protein
MRRALSILFVLLFGLGPLSAVLEASDAAGLPACCRRHGAHHCAASMNMGAIASPAQPNSAPVVSAPFTCPYYPGAIAAVLTHAPAFTTASVELPALTAHTHKPAGHRAVTFASPVRTHAGRGPPSTHLS